MTPEPISTSLVVKHGILAVFGGIVHALSAYRRGETKGWLDIIVLSIISSFTGVIFALIALYLYPNTYLSFAIAGMGGFVGVEGMSWVQEFVRRKLK